MLLQRAIDSFDLLELGVFQRREPGAHEIVAQIGEQHAEGREYTGRERHDDLAHADLARHLDGVQGTGAAIGEQHEIAGIETALGGDALHRVGHRGGGDAQDSVGGLDRAHAERIADLAFERALGGGDVELHLAAQKALGAEPAEHQIGIGHGRLGAAEAVTGGTGRSARALRAEAERAVVDAGDRAATGRDLENVHHGDLHRQRLFVAADQRRARGQSLAVIDDAGLGGGAAHVEGDGIVDFQRPAQRLRADDARSRPGLQHAHALVLGLFGFVEPAGRLDHQERAGEPGLAHMGVDLADIAPHLWADIGVGGHRRAALELAIFLRQLVGGGHE